MSWNLLAPLLTLVIGAALVTVFAHWFNHRADSDSDQPYRPACMKQGSVPASPIPCT